MIFFELNKLLMNAVVVLHAKERKIPERPPNMIYLFSYNTPTITSGL